jgi:hypothetical protein
MRPWLQTAVKVAILAATTCSGSKVPNYNMPVWDKRHEGKRGTRQD